MEVLTYPWIASVLDKLPRDAKALPRALLLTGRPGLGKRAAVLFLAQSLLCETQRAELSPCGICASCRLYQAGNHPDLRTLEVVHEEETPVPVAEEGSATPKKTSRQISVERVRTLTDFVILSAHRLGAKVVCIIPAEAMHPSAANAVLKILEEPPGDTFFLLMSHQPEQLLSTIRSRCFHVPVALPNTGPTLDWLARQGIKQTELALAQGGYAPLAALDRARDGVFWNQRKLLLDTLAASKFDPLHATDFAEDMDGALASTLMAQWAYDLAALKAGGKVRYHIDYGPALQQIAGAVREEALMTWYDALIQFGRVAQHPLNKRLAMESLLAAYPDH